MAKSRYNNDINKLYSEGKMNTNEFYFGMMGLIKKYLMTFLIKSKQGHYKYGTKVSNYDSDDLHGCYVHVMNRIREGYDATKGASVATYARMQVRGYSTIVQRREIQDYKHYGNILSLDLDLSSSLGSERVNSKSREGIEIDKQKAENYYFNNVNGPNRCIGSISKTKVHLFTIAYIYRLNYAKLTALYIASKDLFFEYMKVLAPALKFGIKKSESIEKSANKIYKKLIKQESESLTKEEKGILKTIKLFIPSIFVDNNNKVVKISTLLNRKLNVIVNDYTICGRYSTYVELLNAKHIHLDNIDIKEVTPIEYLVKSKGIEIDLDSTNLVNIWKMVCTDEK